MAGETCWIEVWMDAVTRKHRGRVIDTQTEQRLYRTPKAYASFMDAYHAAREWAEKNNLIEVSKK